MSALSAGPEYTYFSGERKTTVDYIFTNATTAQYLENCHTHDIHELNTSDHLPVSATLSLQTTHLPEQVITQPLINWDQIPTSALQSYHNLIKQTVSNSTCIGRQYASVADLNEEIRQVSQSIKEATRVLLIRKPARKPRKWYRDSTLSQLSKEKKDAWDSWKREGRPTSGPAYI